VYILLERNLAILSSLWFFCYFENGNFRIHGELNCKIIMH